MLTHLWHSHTQTLWYSHTHMHVPARIYFVYTCTLPCIVYCLSGTVVQTIENPALLYCAQIPEVPDQEVPEEEQPARLAARGGQLQGGV